MQNNQMSFNKVNLKYESEPIALIDLFASGLHWLELLQKDKNFTRYSDWMKLVRAARPNDTKLDDKELMWLWEAITTEPNMKNRLGDRIVSLYDEWKEIKAFECLPKNSIFGVFLKGFQAYGYPVVKQLEGINPDAEAEILEPLLMRPGKAFRLECCDVPTILRIRLPGELFAKQEALLFKVEEDDIKIEKDIVEVSVINAAIKYGNIC